MRATEQMLWVSVVEGPLVVEERAIGRISVLSYYVLHAEGSNEVVRPEFIIVKYFLNSRSGLGARA